MQDRQPQTTGGGRQLTEVILDSVADGVFTVDRDLRIAYWNKGAERITGFSSERALGKQCCEVFRASLCGDSCPMKLAMDTGLPSGPVDVDIVTNSLEEIRVSVSAAALRDRDGTFLGGVEAFRVLNRRPFRAQTKGEQEVLESVEGLFSANAQMKRVLSVLPAVARADAPTLITGHSGCGKKLVGRAIHRLSHRTAGPLVGASCAAISDGLRDAGSTRTTSELSLLEAYERAGGGTLVLAEIGDLSLTAQVKLLRLLQEEEYQQAGEPRARNHRTRVISTTSRDLTQAVRDGEIREELFFRLAVITIDVPSLAQRAEDIPLLVERLLITAAPRAGIDQPVTVSQGAMRLLKAHDYPGNVRELENILEHALTVGQSSIITVEHLPSSLNRSPLAVAESSEPPSDERLSDDDILNALRTHRGNKSRAALYLGIHRSTLWRRMKRLGLGASPGEPAEGSPRGRD